MCSTIADVSGASARCAVLEQKLAAGSLLWRTAEWMQPCTPPRKSTRWVNGHGVFTVPGRHSHHSKQFDGQLSPSATDTCPHRSVGTSMRRGRNLALDHGSAYLHPTGGQNHPHCQPTARHLGGSASSPLTSRSSALGSDGPVTDGAIQVEDRGRGDVVMQWSVTAPRHPADGLDVHSQSAWKWIGSRRCQRYIPKRCWHRLAEVHSAGGSRRVVLRPSAISCNPRLPGGV